MPSRPQVLGCYPRARRIGAGKKAGRRRRRRAASSARSSRARSTGLAESGCKAEAQALATAAGKADVVDVVTAVAESEAALETLVAVRDRVIAADQEIMRMPI